VPKHVVVPYVVNTIYIPLPLHKVVLDTNTHTKYVTFIAFPLQQWLHERALILLYTYLGRLLDIYFIDQYLGL